MQRGLRKALLLMSWVSQRSDKRYEAQSDEREKWKIVNLYFNVWSSSGVYILTKSLIPLLEKSADPRVVSLIIQPMFTVSPHKVFTPTILCKSLESPPLSLYFAWKMGELLNLVPEYMEIKYIRPQLCKILTSWKVSI